MNSDLLKSKGAKPKGEGEKRCRKLRFLDLDIFREREREHILSRFSVNWTVGFRLSNKESRSTQRGQRVGTGFEEFRQTP